MSENVGDRLTQTKLSAFFLYPERRKRSAESSLQDASRREMSRDNSASTEALSQEINSQDVSQQDSSSVSNASKSVRKQSSAELDRRRRLAQTAQETKTLLPGILKTIPHAPPHGYLYKPPSPPKLNQKHCPGFSPAEVKVLDADTFDTAINVAKCEQYMTVRDKRPVCVLNMANAQSAGGGWLNGALAQEEALCYRSSLSFTLKLRYYPLQDDQAIYSPTVVIIRDSLQNGHTLLDLTKPEELPVVSVISIAALCRPPLDNSGPRPKYRNLRDRELMKEKMRIILRIAAFNGHRRLVLGAFGCGAFLNPREEVADCWAEVFSEAEFKGGWWESICFAVMDDLNAGKDGNGNFGVFYRRLNGTMV
ncbi:hypothetical protein VTN77DRAFT_6721 [Rasamsonia byssochlamydoides]|uniref:uncharacterized protein n=1 Tax=Rasamsonia byssochlamydoides TaxID=89139 RepID=UPI00374413C0